MAERNLVHRLREHQVAAQQSCDRLAVFLRDRRVKFEPIRGIPLPAQADERESFAQQPCVTSVALGVPVAAIDDAQNRGVTAIRTFENHRAVAFARIFRLDRNESRCDENSTSPFVVAVDGVGEIDDAAIVIVRDCERDVYAADDAFVRASIAERLAVEHVCARDVISTRVTFAESERAKRRAAKRSASPSKRIGFMAAKNNTAQPRKVTT